MPYPYPMPYPSLLSPKGGSIYIIRGREPQNTPGSSETHVGLREPTLGLREWMALEMENMGAFWTTIHRAPLRG